MRYTAEHEWVRSDGKCFTIGITEYAASELGEIVFVELPEVGSRVESDSEVVVIESVKAASEICAPASGTITAINDMVATDPGLLNGDPLDSGWLFEMTFDDPDAYSEFLDADEYQELIS